MVWFKQVYASFFHERLGVAGLRYIVVVWRLQGGYLAIDTDSTRLQYVFTSVYPTIGVPLMSIALGEYLMYVTL